MLYQFDRIRKTFAEQFAQEGPKLVYRKNLKGAPVEVTVAERDFLVGQFNRHLVWMGALTVLLTVLLIVAIAFVTFARNAEFSEPLALLTVFLILAPVMTVGVWAWNAPSRLIGGRTAIGPAKSPSEMKKLGFARLTWQRLNGAAALGLLVLLRVDWARSLLTPSNLMWLLASAFLLIVAGIQTVRKLRAERASPSGPKGS